MINIIERWRIPATAWMLGLLLLCAFIGGTRCSSDEPEPVVPLTEDQILYNQGKYDEALPLLEKRLGEERTGALLYQIGFCRQAVDGDSEARRELWKEAEALLEQELTAPRGVTLDRLYYLTVINLDQSRPAGPGESPVPTELEAMRNFARRAVEEIEKGPQLTTLSGEDWFRLGRVHDILNEKSEAEAAYRRSVSKFYSTEAVVPAYKALALAMVGDLDYTRRRWEAAAEAYDGAVAILPDTDQVKPFQHGLTLIAVGRFEDAVERLEKDRDPKTVTEAQYAADLARMAAEVEPLDEEDADESEINRLSYIDLDERIREAGKAFRASREKHSFKRGDPLTPELAAHQRRFVSLLRERFVRRAKLQDFCINEGVADLVRR